jgi:hypothetical protein
LLELGSLVLQLELHELLDAALALSESDQPLEWTYRPLLNTYSGWERTVSASAMILQRNSVLVESGCVELMLLIEPFALKWPKM